MPPQQMGRRFTGAPKLGWWNRAWSAGVQHTFVMGCEKDCCSGRRARRRRNQQKKTVREKTSADRSYAAFCPNRAYILERREEYILYIEIARHRHGYCYQMLYTGIIFRKRGRYVYTRDFAGSLDGRRSQTRVMLGP